MITFDCEDDGKGNVFLIGFYNGSHYTSFEKSNYQSDDDYRQAVILYILDSKDRLFIAHNLEYDLSHIFQKEYIGVIDWYYSNQLIFAKLPGTHIKFIDSFHFSYTSLKNLGKEIKYHKESIDIENIYDEYLKNPDKVLKYNRIDCEIVFMYMKQFTENIKNEFNIKIKNTLSGTAQNIFLKHFSKFDLAGINVNDILLKAYYGGRVECFHVGQVDNTVFEMDVNSMYPYVMFTNQFPTSEYYQSKEPQEIMYISRVKVTVKNCYIPILPLRTDKLIFPVGTFETWATSVEILKAKQEGQIKEIEYLETYNFPETDYVFSGFINYFYTNRKKAKDDKNKFQSEYYKRIMNHVYGRFALHKELKKLTCITEKNKNSIIQISDFIGYETLESNNKSKNYALSLFVTAYARVYLFDLLTKLSKQYKILYCDTDSCYFTHYGKEGIQDTIKYILKNFKIDNELGNFSFKAYESGIFYNAKAYLLNSFKEEKKIKLKGIKAEYREQFLKEGTVEYRKPVKLRSSLRSVKNIKVNSWELQRITKKGVYEKRNLIKLSDTLFDTRPKKITG